MAYEPTPYPVNVYAAGTGREVVYSGEMVTPPSAEELAGATNVIPPLSSLDELADVISEHMVQDVPSHRNVRIMLSSNPEQSLGARTVEIYTRSQTRPLSDDELRAVTARVTQNIDSLNA